MQRIYWLDPFDKTAAFPPVELAMREPDGLLAAGGDLSVSRLLQAYRHGIFPWYEDGQPILWWSPDPRAVLRPETLRITRSLRKALRNKPYTVTFDRAFHAVMTSCAAPRAAISGTWITDDMVEAYDRLHADGWAHCVEVWNEAGDLIGGLYGLAIGKVFFGESMFSRVSDASKIALVYLARHLQAWGYPLIDCQQETPHLTSMGAVTIPRDAFVALLDTWCERPARPAPWQVDPELDVLGWDPAADRR